ncbi:MAG: ABC transporter ATP-binding protein, partial [Chloroflexi bacterium]|nr:ABC transporter ATP-binding protein [Chloroflexota bacterium]
VTAVDGPSFSIARGSVTGIIGPNGSGKSTLFNLLSGVDRADSGAIVLDGAAIERLPSHAIARRGVGRTFQLVRLFPRMTVMQNMVVTAFTGTQPENEATALKLLELVNLAGLHSELAANLSYGQSKLLEFVRLLMNPYKLILLDEPFAGVNRTLARTLVEQIRRLNAAGVTILIIDHEMHIIMELCQRLLVLDHGELIADGPPSEVRQDERVLAAYFGR